MLIYFNIDINEDMDDLDDMEIDDLELPMKSKMKKDALSSIPDLTLTKHVSFGPIKINSTNKDEC